MAIHFNLVTNRFLDELTQYNEGVEKISAGIVQFMLEIKFLLQHTIRKRKYTSNAIEVFENVNIVKEILNFYKPVKCCEKILTSSETLWLHLKNSENHFNVTMEESMKEQIIFFNIYCQYYAIILKNYNIFHNSIDNNTHKKLFEINAMIDTVLKKPKFVKSKNLFHHVYFKKWKFIFNYDCKMCGGKSIEDTIVFIKINLHNVFINDIKHVKSKEHSDNLMNHAPILEENDANVKLVDYLQSVTIKDIEEILETGNSQQDLPMYDEMMDDLRDKLQSEYPKADFYYFGSRYTGLSTKGSALDIFVDTDDEPMSVFRIVEKILQKHPEEWKDVNANCLSNIPVLKVNNVKHNISCELSFSNKIAVFNSRLIRYLFDLQPICHKLVIFLKKWNRKTGLRIHSAIITILVIFYLQVKKLLPPVEELQKNKDEVVECWVGADVWNVNFNELLTLSDLNIEQSSNFPNILIGLFEYYCKTFDFSTNAVCPYAGKPENKQEFNKIMRPDVPMTVQDFFQHNKNVSLSIAKKRLQKFVANCAITAATLKTKNCL